MNTKENDQDSLQILDELNEEWVEQWRKAVKQKPAKAKDYCQFISPHRENEPEINV